MDDRNSRLPVPLKARPPTHRPSMAPTVWRDAAPVVARGAALVAIGLIGEWLLRAATRRALTPSNHSRSKSRRTSEMVPKPADELPAGTIAVSEEYFMRRTIIRR